VGQEEMSESNGPADKVQLELVRALALMSLSTYQRVLALEWILIKTGTTLTSPELYQEAQNYAAEQCRETREKIEQFGVEKAQSLEDILKAFEGPIQ
jgi:hypothetical protein